MANSINFVYFYIILVDCPEQFCRFLEAKTRFQFLSNSWVASPPILCSTSWPTITPGQNQWKRKHEFTVTWNKPLNEKKWFPRNHKMTARRQGVICLLAQFLGPPYSYKRTSYWNDLNPTTLKYGGAWGGVTQRHQSHVYDKAPVRFSSWIATAKDVKSRCCCSRKQCEQWETKSGNLAWRDGKLYSSSLVSSSGAPRRSDLCWESFNAGTIYSLSIGDLFNNLFNNLLQNSQSVEILKQSQYVGADGKKNKFFFHSHDYQMAAGLPENSHILELWNRLLNRYWIDSWIDCE